VKPNQENGSSLTSSNNYIYREQGRNRDTNFIRTKLGKKKRGKCSRTSVILSTKRRRGDLLDADSPKIWRGFRAEARPLHTARSQELIKRERTRRLLVGVHVRQGPALIALDSRKRVKNNRCLLTPKRGRIQNGEEDMLPERKKTGKRSLGRSSGRAGGKSDIRTPTHSSLGGQ